MITYEVVINFKRDFKILVNIKKNHTIIRNISSVTIETKQSKA